jgi:hypothetical protein
MGEVYPGRAGPKPANVAVILRIRDTSHYFRALITVLSLLALDLSQRTRRFARSVAPVRSRKRGYTQGVRSLDGYAPRATCSIGASRR